MDWTFDWVEELPEHRGGGVAEDGTGATSKDRGHELSVKAQASVAHGIDAMVNAVELPPIDAIADRASAQTGVFELPPRSHSMPPRGDYRHLYIGRVAFLTHVGT